MKQDLARAFASFLGRKEEENFFCGKRTKKNVLSIQKYKETVVCRLFIIQGGA